MEPLNRRETLQLLSSTGIELPPETKLTDQALLARLNLALKLSQELPEVLPSSSSTALKISSLEDWPSDQLGLVQRAIYRDNVAKKAGVEAPTSSDVFYELRHSVLSIAQSWDQRVPCVIVQDPDGDVAALNIRVSRICLFLKHNY